MWRDFDDRLDRRLFGGAGGGVSSWNDLTDKPFYEETVTVEVLPETSFSLIHQDGCEQHHSEGLLGLVVGKKYKVVYNGKEYEYTAVDLNGMGVGFGNLAGIGAENNGEPFGVAEIPSYNGWNLMDYNGNTEATLSITTEDTIIHPIEGKYLPKETAKIIDVFELPTENIDESAFYRVNKVPMMFGTKVLSASSCFCVDSLPEVGEPVTVDTQSLLGYYNRQDGNVYGYVPSALGAGVGVPAGWYPFEMLAGAFGVGWSGIVTSVDDAVDDESYRVLIRSYKMYRYDNGWQLIVDNTELEDLFSKKEKNLLREVDWHITQSHFVKGIDLGDYLPDDGKLTFRWITVEGDFSELKRFLENIHNAGSHSVNRQVDVTFRNNGTYATAMSTVTLNWETGDYTVMGNFLNEKLVGQVFSLQIFVNAEGTELSARCLPLYANDGIYMYDEQQDCMNRIACEHGRLNVYGTGWN